METTAAANAADAPLGAIGQGTKKGPDTTMGRILIILIVLAFIGFLGLIGYAYSGFLQPDVQSVSQPVTLDVE